MIMRIRRIWLLTSWEGNGYPVLQKKVVDIFKEEQCLSQAISKMLTLATFLLSKTIFNEKFKAVLGNSKNSGQCNSMEF